MTIPNDEPEHALPRSAFPGGSGPQTGYRNLRLSAVASLALPLSAVVTGPIFSRTLGEVGRGEVVAVTAPLLLGAGIAAAGLVPTAVYFLTGQRAARSEVERRIWFTALVAGCLVALAVVTMAPVLLRRSPELVGTARLCAVSLPLIVLGRAGRANAVADERFGLIAGSSLGAALARTAGVGGLAVLGRLEVGTAIVIVVGYELLLGLPFFRSGLRSLFGGTRRGSEPSPRGLTSDMARYGGAAAIGSMATIVIIRLDVVILSPLVSPGELGFYVFAVSLGQLWAGLVSAGARVALPVAVRTSDPEAVARLCRVLTAFSVVVVIGSVVLGPSLVGLVYGSGFDKTAALLPWLLGSSSLFALESLPATMLLAKGRPGQRSVGPAVAGVFTALGLLVVTPRYGIEGAAFVSVVSYTMAALVTTWLVTRGADLSWVDYFVVRGADLRRARPAGDEGAGRLGPLDVEALIPTYRRPEGLVRCLESLAVQTRPVARAIVVARLDDLPTRRALEEFERTESIPVQVVDIDRPGQVAALNAGLEKLGADVVAIFDDDVVVEPTWVERATAHLERDARVGGVGGRDRLHTGGGLVEGFTGRPVGRISWYGRTTGLFHLAPPELREVDHLKGCAMALRRDAIGGHRFDDRLLGEGAQFFNDTAFSLGVRRRGWRLLCDGELQVDHFHGSRELKAGRVSDIDEEAWAHAAHNETLSTLLHLSPIRRPVLLAWLAVVGTRNRPGLVQVLRFLPTARRPETLQRWRVARQAQRQAYGTWRRTRSLRSSS